MYQSTSCLTNHDENGGKLSPPTSVLIRGVIRSLIILLIVFSGYKLQHILLKIFGSLWRLILCSSSETSHDFLMVFCFNTGHYQGGPALPGRKINVVSRKRRGKGRDMYVTAVGTG